MATPEQPLDSSKKFVQQDEDAFIKKWSAPLLLGPFIPAIFSIIIIVAGSIILNSYPGSCNFYLSGKLFSLHFFFL